MPKSKIFIASAALVMTAGTAGAAPVSKAVTMQTIEARMPADPLVSTNSAIGDKHVTPSSETGFAEAAINRAIPVGMPVRNAIGALRQAGLHCNGAKDGTAVHCSYADIQTVDEYLDDVRWEAAVQTRDGAVEHIALKRWWSRH